MQSFIPRSLYDVRHMEHGVNGVNIAESESDGIFYRGLENMAAAAAIPAQRMETDENDENDEDDEGDGEGGTGGAVVDSSSRGRCAATASCTTGGALGAGDNYDASGGLEGTNSVVDMGGNDIDHNGDDIVVGSGGEEDGDGEEEAGLPVFVRKGATKEEKADHKKKMKEAKREARKTKTPKHIKKRHRKAAASR